jgi:hypothetical protein
VLLCNGWGTHSHRNYIQSIARQLSMTIEGLLETVFSVGSAPRLYSEDPRLVECSEAVGW